MIPFSYDFMQPMYPLEHLDLAHLILQVAFC